MMTDPSAIEEPMTFVGGRANVLSHEQVVPGSVLTKCDLCKQDVWLTENTVTIITLRIRRGRKDKVICVTCLVTDVIPKEGQA